MSLKPFSVPARASHFLSTPRSSACRSSKWISRIKWLNFRSIAQVSAGGSLLIRRHLLSRISLSTVLSLLLFPQLIHAEKALPLSDALTDLSQQLTAKLQQGKKGKLAILPFSDLDGRTTMLGKHVAEELITGLFTLGSFEIVERAMLDKVLGEIKLKDIGIVDPQTAQKVGQVAGVDAIVTGSITSFKSYLALNCRVIETSTGRVFAVAQVKVIKDAEVIAIYPAPEGASGSSIPGSTKDQQATSLVPDQRQVAHEADFTFVLQGCARSGGSLRCELMVTNDIEDRAIQLVSARLVDQLGNELRSSRQQLGGDSNAGFSTVQRKLANDVPTKAVVQFSGLPDAATKAALIEIEIYSADRVKVGGFSGRGSNGRTTVKFRNVPIASR